MGRLVLTSFLALALVKGNLDSHSVAKLFEVFIKGLISATRRVTMGIFAGTKHRASSLIVFLYLLSLSIVQIKFKIFQRWKEINSQIIHIFEELRPRRKTKGK